jgi:hypothetical protein
MRKKKIYIVLHHEIMLLGNEYVADEMVFQVASSMRRALAYIRSYWVEPYSWWEIQETAIDNPDWPEHYGWYGRRGGKLNHAPYKRALAAYKRRQNDPTHDLGSCS